MAERCAGQIVAFYLFDIAETIGLTAVPTAIGAPGIEARLAPKRTTSAYVQHEKPPLGFDGEVFGAGNAGFRPRVRLYDYGVVSIALTRDFDGPWAGFVTTGADLVERSDLEKRAEQLSRTVAARIHPALRGVRDGYLSEDYLVFALSCPRSMPDSTSRGVSTSGAAHGTPARRGGCPRW